MNPETIQPTLEQTDHEQNNAEPMQAAQSSVVGQQPIVESQQPAASVTQPVIGNAPLGMKPKKSKLVMILILVVILMVGAAAAFLFLKKDKTKTNNDTNQTSNTQNTTPTASLDTPSNTVSAIETKMKDLLDTQGIFTYENRKNDKSSGTVYAQADTKDYFANVSTANDSTLVYMLTVKSGTNAGTQTETPNEEKTILDGLKKYMVDSGFTYKNSVTFNSETDDYTFYNYEKNAFQCSLNVSAMLVEANCVETATAEKAKADIAPFAKILKDNKVSGFAAVSLKIEDGKNGYKIATLFTSPPQKYIILQKAGSTTWKYFDTLSYQSISNCSVFEKNTDAKLAFEGYSCLRNNADSVVKKS